MTAVDVHGATLDAPIFAETVSAFNILLADGTVTTINEKSPAVGGWSPLQFARVSLGGLGVVTSITIDVLMRTNPDAIGAWPARVTGYSRGWYHQFANYVGSTCTFLGAVEDKGKTINGAIYKVADIETTKKREVGYTAIALKSSEIEMLDGGGAFEVGKSTNVYIFVSNPEPISKTKAPTAECPMVQSYVDICISGCLEIDAMYRAARGSFTQEFISSTTGWSANWVNDRIYPRRSLFTLPLASEIDRALKEGNVLHYVQLHDLR